MSISFIVPVYNTDIDKFKRCIFSVESFNQNLDISDYEIIVIDDGSSSTNSKTYEKFLKQIKNIIYIKNKNHGVSYSRNFGIKKSTKKYVTFVDSDDYLMTNYIKNIDISFNENLILFDIFVSTKNKINKYDFEKGKVDWENALISHMIKSSFTNPVAKFYDKKFLIDNNIRFNVDFVQGEDYLFNMEFLDCKPTIYYYNYPIYTYDFNSQTTSNRWKNNFDKILDNKIDIYYRKIELLKKYDFKDKNKIYNEINNLFVYLNFRSYLTLIQINDNLMINKFVHRFISCNIDVKSLKNKQKIYYNIIKKNRKIVRFILQVTIKIKKIIKK